MSNRSLSDPGRLVRFSGVLRVLNCTAGDAFDVHSFADVCDFDSALAKGEFAATPDTDGCVPKRAPH